MDQSPKFDVVIVGARAAGAATAMLLARAGVKTLVIDRAAYGTDTLSSHAILHEGVEHLRRWQLLDDVASAAPPIRRTVIECGDTPLAIDHQTKLFAPRRTRLDPILVDAARDAGALFWFDSRAIELLIDSSGRVTGLVVEHNGGTVLRVAADLVIGADGLRSFVARAIGAPVTHSSRHWTASIYTYLRSADLAADEYHFAYRDGLIGGAIPTTDDLHCVFVSMTPTAFGSGLQLDVRSALLHTLDRVAPSIAEGARRGTSAGPFRSFPGHPGQTRKPHGPGWALVGDASSFTDPVAARGLSDAFRDAEMLSRAVVSGDFAGYELIRDNLSMPFFRQIDRLTALDWTATEVEGILADMAAAMADELQTVQQHLETATASR